MCLASFYENTPIAFHARSRQRLLSSVSLDRHRRMNWEMLSAIGQVVAAIGVIPSLIYLAVQIREQNKERRRAVE